jgi:hypothetical protein
MRRVRGAGFVRRLRVGAAALVLFAIGGVGASADPPSPANPAGHELGLVPLHSASADPGGSGDQGTVGDGKPKPSGSGPNLVYHGGPVMHTNTVYAVYWVPAGYSVSSGYESVINGFFSNLQAAQNASSNVYWSGTQYSDGGGNVQQQSSFAGAIYDSDPLPASGCSDRYTKVCLTDGQLQQELQKVVPAGTANANTVFFLFTASGIGSCYSSSSCALTQYCAYHSSFTSPGGTIVYANMPYANTAASYGGGSCDSGQAPSGDVSADSELNLVSHEHNESITDWGGNAWYDNRGYEDGDKCAWNFGSPLGGSSGSQYNQTIGTGRYYLQQEWSNNSSGCVLTGL